MVMVWLHGKGDVRKKVKTLYCAYSNGKTSVATRTVFWSCSDIATVIFPFFKSISSIRVKYSPTNCDLYGAFLLGMSRW